MKKLRWYLGNALGWLLFFPPAVLTTVFWMLYGQLAWLPGKIAGMPVEGVKLFSVIGVGPLYTTARLFKLWSYVGWEPEDVGQPHMMEVPTLRLDLTPPITIKWRSHLEWFAENLRGDESWCADNAKVDTRRH